MSDDRRAVLFEDSRTRLEEMAGRAVKRGLKKFATIIIDAEDEYWKPLVDKLMPDYDWSKWDGHEIKVARGTVTIEALEFIALACPNVAPILSRPPPEGKVYAVVCGYGGVSVYSVGQRDEPN